ncbi:MAG: hypothetical protein JWQ50_9353 [Caballeronia mineralivorans]|nr:hypothetical protein [Caballeronia mineralivorans]
MFVDANDLLDDKTRTQHVKDLLETNLHQNCEIGHFSGKGLELYVLGLRLRHFYLAQVRHYYLGPTV